MTAFAGSLGKRLLFRRLEPDLPVNVDLLSGVSRETLPGPRLRLVWGLHCDAN